jgi:hypothetical protein
MCCLIGAFLDLCCANLLAGDAHGSKRDALPDRGWRGVGERDGLTYEWSQLGNRAVAPS